MSQRIYTALQSGGDVPQLSALTPLDEMVAALNAFEPEILLGYPTVAVLLAAEQLAGRLRIAPRMMAFGSEPLTVEMRERIFEAWGIDPGEYYATTEAATIASSTPEHPRALEIFEDQYVIEIVDEANRPVPPGTAGAKVLVTNLENRRLPLIRYERADRVSESPEPNPAGRPYRHLAGIDGRTADTLTFPAAGGARWPCSRCGWARRSRGCRRSGSSRSSTTPAGSRSGSCSIPAPRPTRRGGCGWP
jgi:phenylacetate-CoA ligase